MSKTLIMVGYLPALIPVVDELLPDVDVVIIDDPELAARSPVQKAVAASPRRRLSAWPYPQSATADAWYHHNRELDVIAVVPAVEYAIVFAARLAERFGVPGATLGAAQLLRDKALLRTVSAAAGVRNPGFASVNTFEDVLAFAEAHPGPLVLKPSNRQASVGTRIVPDSSELELAWQQVQDQDEAAFIAFQHLPLRLQVEQFITGEEFSVEMLMQDGSPLFANVTGKLLHPGVRPVEFGHIVPAQISPSEVAVLTSATERLLDVVGFRTGVVHCEWIVSDGEPYLVECTGRLPGDGIVHLIQRAWPIDLIRRYLVAMLGRPNDPAPTKAQFGAATLFPLFPAGVVTAVDGLDEAGAVPGVYINLCSVKPGDRINELRSSWDRVYGVAVCAATSAEALAGAFEAIGKVSIQTTPEAAIGSPESVA